MKPPTHPRLILRRAMHDKGLNIPRLAAAAGLFERTVRRIVYTGTPMRVATCVKLCAPLDLCPTHVFVMQAMFQVDAHLKATEDAADG